MDTGLIQLEPREGGVLEAHIGMLKSHHTYSAEIPVAHSLGTSITAQHPQHNIYVRVKSVGETATVRETGNRYKTPVTVHVKTIKEGNIAERIELVLEEDSATSLSLLVTAKVLHTHQGNPLLKDGVHVVSHEHGEDSENTEWPGHWRDQSHLPADDDDEDTLL
jgi:hypothetical protein